MIRVYLAGIGIMAPGLKDWDAALPVLRGESEINLSPIPTLKPKYLSKGMLRRTTRHIRMAVGVAGQTIDSAGEFKEPFASVFSASENDPDITDEICQIVVSDEPFVSASSFNNSVSNAAVGAWSIAIKSQQPTTCVTGYDATFPVGLMEAGTQAHVENINVLLVSHDVIADEPLLSLRPLLYDFGVGLLLTPKPGPETLAELNIAYTCDERKISVMDNERLEHVRGDNPSARSLPLLEKIARKDDGKVILPYHDDCYLEVNVINGPA